jgi:hypothetical protein
MAVVLIAVKIPPAKLKGITVNYFFKVLTHADF